MFNYSNSSSRTTAKLISVKHLTMICGHSTDLLHQALLSVVQLYGIVSMFHTMCEMDMQYQPIPNTWRCAVCCMTDIDYAQFSKGWLIKQGSQVFIIDGFMLLFSLAKLELYC